MKRMHVHVAVKNLRHSIGFPAAREPNVANASACCTR